MGVIKIKEIRSNDILMKQTKNNGLLSIKEIPIELAKDILVKNHYSKKWNHTFGIINFGIFQDDNPNCLGVLSLGRTMNSRSYKQISDNLDFDNILELNRLWVDDCLGRNAETVFISLSFKYLKKHYPEVKVVQSFADGRLGCGTIYKASNFKYYGYHETLFFEHIDNKDFILHKVPLENTSRLIPMISKNIPLVRGELRAFKVKTYRYIYLLDKKVNIKLKEKEYPPYEKGKNYIDNFKQKISVLSRIYMGLHIAGDGFENEKEDVLKYIYDNYGEYTHEELKEASTSKFMVEVYENEDKYRKYLREKLRTYLSDMYNQINN